MTGQRLPDGVELIYDYTHYGCTDPSPAVLGRFADLTGARVEAWTGPLPPPDDRLGTMRLRSRLYAAALDRAAAAGDGHALIVEPTVLLGDAAVTALLNAAKPVVAPVMETDAALDLPPQYRDHNVLASTDGSLGYEAPYAPLRSLPVGLFQCHVVTRAYLVEGRVLQAGARPVPHPAGEDVGFCETALARGIAIWADTAAGARLAVAPEVLYLEGDPLTAAVCKGGTLRLDRTADGGLVTLATSAVAHLVTEALAARLRQLPSAAGWRPHDVAFDWGTGVVSVRCAVPTAG